MKNHKFSFLKSMNVQLALYFLVASFAMISFLAIVFYLSASSIVLNDGTRQTNESIAQASQYIEGYLERVKGLSDIIAMHPDTLKAIIDKDPQAQKSLASMMDVAKQSDDRIATIAVISKEGFMLSSGSDMAMPLSQDMMDQSWYIEAMRSMQMPALTNTRHDTLSKTKENWVISDRKSVV